LAASIWSFGVSKFDFSPGGSGAISSFLAAAPGQRESHWHVLRLPRAPVFLPRGPCGRVFRPGGNNLGVGIGVTSTGVTGAPVSGQGDDLYATSCA